MAFINGKFPKVLKLAKIVPLYKKSDPKSVLNYRFISILNTISKVIEKCIANRMVDYLEKNNLLTESQHGYRPGKSTESASVHFFQYIYTCLDNGEYVAAVLFDFSSAFDCLSHELLYYKLLSFGFEKNELKFVMDYLSNREVKVNINGISSKPHTINLGVPQGSVLGPLIFLLFINDLAKHMHNLKIKIEITLFADDCSMATSARSLGELQENVNIIMCEFKNWAIANRLVCNAEKTIAV